MRGEIENIWQAMKKSHYQRTLDKLTYSMQQVNDWQGALTAALEIIATAVRAETGTVWIYERYDRGRIYPYAVYGGSDLSGVSLSPGEGIAGRVIETGKSVIVKDCQADPRWAGRVDARTGFTTRSMICVPLTYGNMTFGSIQIINNLDGHFFDEKDLSFMDNLSTEIASLLKKQGYLDKFSDYMEEETKKKREATFREVFIEGNAMDMQRKLYEIKEFSELPYHRQHEIMQLCKRLRDSFSTY